MFIGLLELFIEDNAQAAEQTRQDLARGAQETAARRMHTLRSNAGFICAQDLMIWPESWRPPSNAAKPGWMHSSPPSATRSPNSSRPAPLALSGRQESQTRKKLASRRLP